MCVGERGTLIQVKIEERRADLLRQDWKKVIFKDFVFLDVQLTDSSRKTINSALVVSFLAVALPAQSLCVSARPN